MSQSHSPAPASLGPSAAGDIPPPPDAGLALVARIERTFRKLERTLSNGASADGIHDVRKAVKEYRALLRLVDSPQARQARRAAGDAARALSATRDRQAARDALGVLHTSGRLGAPEVDQLLPAIGNDETGSDAAAAGLAGLLQWLGEARALHAAVLDQQILEANLAHGLRRGYARARAGARWDTPEHIHDLRKRVVTHRYQMSFFAKLHGGVGLNRAQKVQDLREVLGTCQDIEALGTVMERVREDDPDAVPPALLSRLAEAGKAQQAQLVRQAKRAHGKLFHRTPKAFLQRLERKWRNAQAQSSAPAEAQASA